MARTRGTLGISANFEPKTAAPFDARSIVATKAELILQSTWLNADGNVYTYKGMVVSVTDDPTATNNGIYRLKAADYTVSTNWEIAGTGASDPNSHTHANKAALDLINKDVNNNPTWNGGAWPGSGGAAPTAENVNTALQGFTEGTPQDSDFLVFIGKIKITLANFKTLLATAFVNTFAAKTHSHATSEVTGLDTALSGKVSANATITGATKTKITYDSKGLVTGGSDLAESDIPTLSQSKITNLTNDLAGKEPTISKSTGLLSWTGSAWAWIANNFLTSSSLKTVNGNNLVGSGDITISGGVTSVAGKTGVVTLVKNDITDFPSLTPADNSITNAKLSKTTVAGRIKGSKTSGDGSIEDLTPAEALELIGAKAASYNGAFAEEYVTVAAGSGNAITLKKDTLTAIANVLDSTVTGLTVSFPTPVAGSLNQSILYFKIGATLPTGLLMFGGFTPLSTPVWTSNSTWQFIYTQVRVGESTWNKLVSFSKLA